MNSLIVLVSVVISCNFGPTLARAPGLYYPPAGAGADDYHAMQLRSHLNDNSLTPLSENELETLLYLLDKVERPPAPAARHPQLQQHRTPNYYGTPTTTTGTGSFQHGLMSGGRNKRTGIHHLTALSPVAMAAAAKPKKSVDWSEYWGIDKREVKTAEAPIKTLTHSQAPAKTEKEKEEVMEEFYKNMAMAMNVKKRKRDVGSSDSENESNTALDQMLNKVGDDLVWDAVKLTGSHRDEKMSPEEFEEFKEKLIQKIGAAYNLEKLREVLTMN